MRNHKVEKAEKDSGDGRSLFHIINNAFWRWMLYLSLSDQGKKQMIMEEIEKCGL